MINILIIIGLIYIPLMFLSYFKESFKTKLVSKTLIVMASIMSLGYLYVGFYDPFYLFLSIIWIWNTHINYSIYKRL